MAELAVTPGAGVDGGVTSHAAVDAVIAAGVEVFPIAS